MVTLKRTSYLHTAERGERERGRERGKEGGGERDRGEATGSKQPNNKSVSFWAVLFPSFYSSMFCKFFIIIRGEKVIKKR